jgi:hypothetical protein
MIQWPTDLLYSSRMLQNNTDSYPSGYEIPKTVIRIRETLLAIFMVCKHAISLSEKICLAIYLNLNKQGLLITIRLPEKMPLKPGERKYLYVARNFCHLAGIVRT